MNQAKVKDFDFARFYIPEANLFVSMLTKVIHLTAKKNSFEKGTLLSILKPMITLLRDSPFNHTIK
jgi:hypothetical protein